MGFLKASVGILLLHLVLVAAVAQETTFSSQSNVVLVPALVKNADGEAVYGLEATDFIVDNSLPRKRLILAGVSGSKCFVQYEQGGFGLSFQVAFFELTSPSTMRPLWLGYCGPAKDLADLRSQVKAGCSQ